MSFRAVILALATAGFALLSAAPARAVVRVLVNQVGYEPAARKVAIVEGNPGDDPTSFELIDAASGATVLHGQLHSDGRVNDWQQRLASGQERPWLFWTADFSAWQKTGDYVVRVGQAQSCPFAIQQDVLERNTISNVIYYFKGQRASGDFNTADAHLPDPSHPGHFLDLSGGWYDATGDYGIHLAELGFTNYFDNQPVPLSAWSLLATYGVLKGRGDANFTQYERRLLDEGLYGADFLVRSQEAGESFFDGVSAPGVHKWARDRRLDDPNYRPEIKTKPASAGGFLAKAVQSQYEYQISFREGAGMAIAALAMASTMPRSGPDGHFPAARYREAAESAFRFLRAHNRQLNGGPGNLLDEYSALLAATELYKATDQAAYLADADHWAGEMTARLASREPYRDYWRVASGPRPFFSPSDAGLPVVSLSQYAAIAGPENRRRALDAVRRSLEFELWITRQVNNPFGYARQLVEMGKGGEIRAAFFFPHDTAAAPWWQGENARLASLAAAARLAAPYFDNDPRFKEDLERYASDQLDWILGRNPYGACMLNGSGRGSDPYMFFDSWQYTSAPGSIVNGITAGLNSEDSIAYNLGYAITGKDTDWRWTEQWLPHAAWYLYAAGLTH
ncbi:MAG TPA: glycoside hydrolase family 9 protein [Candidatus Acidoferrum sp.]|nr:glycoside hydrolase family 9 protein [Candidatus Acidoferrum sp.]